VQDLGHNMSRCNISFRFAHAHVEGTRMEYPNRLAQPSNLICSCAAFCFAHLREPQRSE
jgi:hypothetical protein